MTFGKSLGIATNAVLVVLGAAAIKAFLMDNGLLKLGESIYYSTNPTMNDNNVPLQTKFFGLAPLDQRLSLFSLFFGPALNGQNPGLSLLGMHFAGQMIPVYLVMLVESYRIGNSWKLISFSAMWFFMVENVGSMLFTPLWCLIHLLTSPTVQSNMSLTLRRNSLLVHPIELRSIPWSVLIASGIPVTLLLSLPMEPQSPRWKSAQFWISVRQYHPFLTALAHLLVSMSSRKSPDSRDPPAQRNRKVASSLRQVYRIATYFAMFTHVQTVSLALVAQFQPTWLSSPYREAFVPQTVWRPYPFWQGVPKMSSFAIEATKFLQWDEIISDVAFLSWSFALNRDGVATMKKGSGWIKALLRTVVLTVVGGPATAGIDLLRERDEMFLEDEDSTEEKKTI